MGIFKRAARIVEANVNKLMDRLEDPNETLDLSYEKMVVNLQEIKKHLADVVAEEQRLQTQLDKSQEAMQNHEQTAREALQLDREDLAKEALYRKQDEATRWKQLKEDHRKITQQVEKLKATERKYREHIRNFGTKKDVTKATYQAAEGRVKASESLADASREAGSAGSNLRRAEEKTEDMAARAEAVDELTANGVFHDADDGDAITRELEGLSQESAVENDLQRLKKEGKEE
ncbi:PspA/IM30 family protein [Alicyclobacillus sp. SO9]|uniref:PspA/IM30 family protein n=1 Tax=Alicyclobacillus sp. SO9 TaxID=2665646 RepID=UPI0018E6E347|nr:PspA/IM30 family protein [Alicyclobacillus sp. SO9]QQE79011.1 PspA/IM30 family protein [Alicyclobacillus sp. SO9]